MFIDQLPEQPIKNAYLLALHAHDHQRTWTMELATEQNRTMTLIFEQVTMMICPPKFTKRYSTCQNDRLITLWEEPQPLYILIGFENGATLILAAHLLEVKSC